MKLSFRSIAIAAALAAIIGGLCLAYGYFIEPNRLVVTRAELKLPGWSADFEDLRIVAIADIHGGSNGASGQQIRKVVRVANEQNPDLIVLLGDYVSQYNDGSSIAQRPLRMPMREVADNLQGLTAKYGVFAVLGNHDGFHDDNEVAAELQRIGITVLRNQMAVVGEEGRRLRILGLNDHMKLNSWASFDGDVREILKNSPTAGDIIVLEHSPDIFQVLNHYKMLGPAFKLMIAGHTHGGQIWFPIIGSPIVPSSFGQKYNRGHVREHGSDMFVTTGVGTSILPFRFLMPPEIAVLTVGAE